MYNVLAKEQYNENHIYTYIQIPNAYTELDKLLCNVYVPMDIETQK